MHDIYYHDVSYQVFVLEKLGFQVEKACLVHINRDYVRGKELEIDKLFTVADLTEMVRGMQPGVEERTRSLKEYILQEEEPEKGLGRHTFIQQALHFLRHVLFLKAALQAGRDALAAQVAGNVESNGEGGFGCYRS